ncbi:GAF domain-containing protein [Arthrobacter pityocampae]|uniref:GAF domain-containing protein n=1 Tax=Arthrobacter pityocampae TaxID=547334 RepID=UPI000CE579EF|nr:GAF domain-containing protein [Arthrobacter pityocampae]
MEDLWVRYYAMGGTASWFELEACLAGVLVLDGGECRILVDAANALLSQARSGTRVDRCADTSPERLLSGAGHGLGAAGAFLLTPREREAERVDAVVRTGLLDTGPEDRFDRISRQAQHRFQVSSVMITVIDDDRCFGKSVIGPLRRSVPRTVSLSTAALHRAGPVVVEDASADERFRENPFVRGDPHVRFFAGYPVRGPLGWLVGSLCVADQVPRSFSTADVHALRALALDVEDEVNGPRALSEL